MEPADDTLHTLKASLERIETTLHRAQRLEAVGQLTAGLAHDFNSVISVVLGNLWFLEREFKENGAAVRRLELMRAAAERGAKLVEQLLSVAGRRRSGTAATDLNRVLDDLAVLLRGTLGADIRFEVNREKALWHAACEVSEAELAVLNLAIFARDSVGCAGSVMIETANGAPGERDAGEHVMLAVRSERHAARQPWPGRPADTMGGSPLEQVIEFARQNGGRVKIDSDTATTVRLCLPRAAPP